MKATAAGSDMLTAFSTLPFSERLDARTRQLKELAGRVKSSKVRVTPKNEDGSEVVPQVVPLASLAVVDKGPTTVLHLFRGGADQVRSIWPQSTVDLAGARLFGVLIERCAAELASVEIFPLLLTGERPRAEDHRALLDSFHGAASTSGAFHTVRQVIDGLPGDLSPTAMMDIALAHLREQSDFTRQAFTLLGVMPYLYACIICKRHGKPLPMRAEEAPASIEDAIVLYLGDLIPNPDDAREFIRAYLVLLSSHSTNLSSSAAQNYASGNGSLLGTVRAGLEFLWTPAHGAAQSLVGDMLEDLNREFGDRLPNEDELTAWAVARLKAGKPIDGIGHRVIHGVHDPRAVYLRDWAKGIDRLNSSGRFQLVMHLMTLFPTVLARQEVQAVKAISNPFFNVDGVAGPLQPMVLGVTDPDCFVLLFAIARSVDYMAAHYYRNALGIAINRADSVTLEEVEEALGSVVVPGSEG